MSIFSFNFYKNLSNTVFTATPTGINEPGIAIVLLHFLSHHFSINCWVQGQESRTETSGEGWDRLFDTNLSAS